VILFLVHCMHSPCSLVVRFFTVHCIPEMAKLNTESRTKAKLNT
jgi:hypothetical protein